MPDDLGDSAVSGGDARQSRSHRFHVDEPERFVALRRANETIAGPIKPMHLLAGHITDELSGDLQRIGKLLQVRSVPVIARSAGEEQLDWAYLLPGDGDGFHENRYAFRRYDSSRVQNRKRTIGISGHAGAYFLLGGGKPELPGVNAQMNVFDLMAALGKQSSQLVL